MSDSMSEYRFAFGMFMYGFSAGAVFMGWLVGRMKRKAEKEQPSKPVEERLA